MERNGRRWAHHPAVADGLAVHTDWQAFAARTAAIAAGFSRDLGLVPGDRVAMTMNNRPEYLEALFGAWHVGLASTATRSPTCWATVGLGSPWSTMPTPLMVKRLSAAAAIVDGNLANLKTIVYRGAPMYLSDLEDALGVFGPKLAQIYGQGETPMTISPCRSMRSVRSSCVVTS